MTTFRLAVLAAACAASAALAQTAPAPAAAPAAPGAATGPNPSLGSAPGAIGPNPSFGTAPGATMGPNPSFGAAPGATFGTNPSLGTAPGSSITGSPGAGGIGNTSNSVAAQAQQRRQLALQQCQALSGASRSDCIATADADFSRATGADALALQGQGSVVPGTQGQVPGTTIPPIAGAPGAGMAVEPRTTPDVSPTPRDNNFR
jgi:hypothetical protein